ncbi:MAG: ABC transporter substrate-binding protein [Actinomycetes bacterium]
MGVSRRRWLWGPCGALVAVLAVALVAAGCGSSSSSSTASSTPSASAGGASTATVAGVVIKADPALHQLLPAKILNAGQIRVASDIPYAPWEYYDPATSKNPAGFDYDLSQAIGATLGIKAAFVEQPYDTIILSVTGGKNDMIMSNMFDNATREKQVSFVDYALDSEGLLVLKGNPHGIKTSADLAGKTVSTESGTYDQGVLEALNKQFKSAGKPQMQLLVLPTEPGALLAVSSGRAVATLSDYGVAKYTAQTAGNGNTFEVVQDPQANDFGGQAIVGAGILKSDTQLVTAVQKALQQLIDNGAYAKIINKYGLLPVKSAEVNTGGQPVSASPSP